MPGWSIVFDQSLRREMQVELKRLQRSVGITFVFVTHDQEEALVMSDRVGVMNAGRIEQLDVAATVFEEGSILDRVPMPSLRTQTAPFATASGSGVGADQHDALHGTGMVATTRFEPASIRATVPARLIATQTVSPSSARPDGPPSCAIVCTT